MTSSLLFYGKKAIVLLQTINTKVVGGKDANELGLEFTDRARPVFANVRRHCGTFRYRRGRGLK